MIYINGCQNLPETCRFTGFYFKPETHQCKHFIILILEPFEDKPSQVRVYELPIPQENCQEVFISNGEEIATSEGEYVLSIDLWGKRFCPKFNTNLEMFYPSEDADEIMALAEVMNYAIELGIKKTGLKVY